MPASTALPTRPGRTARRDAGVRTAAGSALWLSLLLVTYLWAAGGGIVDLGAGFAEALVSLGRWTGLVASNLLLVQVILMARLPFLERAFGQDRMNHQHRLVGFTSFNLMLAHIGLITWGYAAGRLSASPAMLWNLTVTYPGMLLAAAGTLCLFLVTFTSIKAARGRLRYESWHLLHLYAYLGVGLALPHQLWTGQQFLTSAAATVYWWSLWAAAAAAVLVWRVALPLVRSLRHGIRVTSVVPEGDGTWSVYMAGRRLDRLGAQAGQFFTWRFLDREGWTRGNPYSLSAAPDGTSLRISVKALGDNSARMRHLRPGTRVMVEGPFGRLSERPRTRRKVALIGAGVGMAPLRALAEGLDYAPGEAVILQRFTTQPLFERELAQLSHERGLGLLWLPGRRRAQDSWLGSGVGEVDDATALRSWVPDVAERDLYICGPEAWTETVRLSALRAGVPETQVHVEKFRW